LSGNNVIIDKTTMKTKIVIGFIVLLLLGACGDAAPELPKLSGDAVILAFGDSLTYGKGAKENESYPDVLESLTGRSVINEGISGEVSAEGLLRLPELLDEYQPDLLVLCHGGNDLLRKQNLTTMESNVRKMIQLAKARNIPVVLLGVPKPGVFLSTYEGYNEIASETGVVFIENLILDVLTDNSLKSDSVHPNKNGYKVMAETIYSTLQESGAL
jgi:acyl-CoA thioesterase I